MKKSILIVLLLGVLGVGGLLYFIKSKQSTNLADQSPSQSENQPLEAAPEPKIKDSPKKAKYLVIKEWGVRMKLSDGVTDAYYKYSDNYNMESIMLYRKSTAKVEGCAGDAILGIIRATNGGIITPGGAKLEEVLPNADQYPDKQLQKIGKYYFFASGPQAPCFNDPDSAAEKQLNQISSPIYEAYKTLEGI